MAREPSYPEDAPVADQRSEVAGTDTPAAAAAAASAVAPKQGSGKLIAGAAIGIGSAALVAALMYANRSRKGGTRT